MYRSVRGRPLTRVEATQGDRVRSRSLGCFLRATGRADSPRVRLGVGPKGDDLFPTGEEAERAARDAAMIDRETEREAKNAAVAARDAAIAARDAALERLARLETNLRRGGRRSS